MIPIIDMRPCSIIAYGIGIFKGMEYIEFYDGTGFWSREVKLLTYNP